MVLDPPPEHAVTLNLIPLRYDVQAASLHERTRSERGLGELERTA